MQAWQLQGEWERTNTLPAKFVQMRPTLLNMADFLYQKGSNIVGNLPCWIIKRYCLVFASIWQLKAWVKSHHVSCASMLMKQSVRHLDSQAIMQRYPSAQPLTGFINLDILTKRSEKACTSMATSALMLLRPESNFWRKCSNMTGILDVYI